MADEEVSSYSCVFSVCIFHKGVHLDHFITEDEELAKKTVAEFNSGDFSHVRVADPQSDVGPDVSQFGPSPWTYRRLVVHGVEKMSQDIILCAVMGRLPWAKQKDIIYFEPCDLSNKEDRTYAIKINYFYSEDACNGIDLNRFAFPEDSFMAQTGARCARPL
jgi:hypothetical protein